MTHRLYRLDRLSRYQIIIRMHTVWKVNVSWWVLCYMRKEHADGKHRKPKHTNKRATVHFVIKERTLIQDSKLLPYFCSKASLMSPKSISDRLTMIRMRVLSFVPIPAIDLYRRSAKKSTFELQHFTKGDT